MDKNKLNESEVLIEPDLYGPDYDTIETLNYLKIKFKPLVFNQGILTYFGINALWLPTRYK